MGDPILILHGWGSTMSGQKYHKVKELLEKKGHTVFTPDLPGFGNNEIKKDQLFFEDYIEFVRNFVQKYKLQRVILVGHSFGGRIAIAFTSRYPELVSMLILVSASGIPHTLSLKQVVAQFVTKNAKLLFSLPVISLLYQPARKLLYKSIGEMDYYKSGKLQKTFQNVYKVSIVDSLDKITKPTLILWGENDTFTPVEDGKLMNKNIKNSRLVVVSNEGHKLPYEDPERFAKEIVGFIS